MRLLAMCSLVVAVVAGCASGARGGRAFVEGVYRAYDPERGGTAPWEEPRCRATFSDALCARIAADRARAGDEVPNLDGDPLYDAQDFGVSELRVVERAADRVEVSFVNLGRARQLLLELVREGGGWRIDDIVYLHERPVRRLREILEAPR